LTLVALDIPGYCVIGSLNLKGQQAAKNVGDIKQILVARSFQGWGLGSLMLEGLIELALIENLHWLTVEIVTEMEGVINGFQSKGFKVKTILDDFFTDSKGMTFDVALMLRSFSKNNNDDF
jgi:GNAT superfamily N-acetyltransferase